MNIANRRLTRPDTSESEDEPVAGGGPGGGGVVRHVPGVVVPGPEGNGSGHHHSGSKMTEERSDTESPVGPVKTNNSNPGHSYVNLLHNGQEVHSDNETPPPLVAKKERSR